MTGALQFFGGEEIATAVSALGYPGILAALVGQPEDELLLFGHQASRPAARVAK